MRTSVRKLEKSAGSSAAPEATRRRAALPMFESLTRPDPIRQLEDDLKQAAEDPSRFPRTTKLMAAGAPQQAKKMVEEAAELAIEAVRRDRDAAVREAADLVYNLVVLLEGMQISFDEVRRELNRRRTAYGIAAKPPKTGDSTAVK
jgi:phosphoribosyl-ATP pyrophosphohydrolase